MGIGELSLAIPIVTRQIQISGCQPLNSMVSRETMVSVAQLAEHWVVASVVVGSSPITHPIKNPLILGSWLIFSFSLYPLFS
jgi:hypothetical protein